MAEVFAIDHPPAHNTHPNRHRVLLVLHGRMVVEAEVALLYVHRCRQLPLLLQWSSGKCRCFF